MRIHRLTLAAAAAIALLPSSALAAGRTETFRFYSQNQALVLTHADGTVVDHAPYPEAKPGDTLDIYAVDYKGTHARHAKTAFASEHVVCRFGDAPEPDCVSHVALGGSLLIFSGSPGTVIGGSGRYYGASGRVLSSKEVDGGSDIVARITRRG
jgi:hypothetical protein